MNEGKISVRYAKALLQVALEKKSVESVRKDIELILATCQQSAELDVILKSPVLKFSEKLSVLKKAFASAVSADTLAFIELLVKNNREAHLAGSCRVFLDLYKKELNIRTVTLTSVSPLSGDQKTLIIRQIEQHLNAKVELIEKIDSSILGGFVLRIDDQQIDASVAYKLHQVKQALLTAKIA